MLRERAPVRWLGLGFLLGITIGLAPRASAPPPPPAKVHRCGLVPAPTPAPDPDAELRAQYAAMRAIAFDPASTPIEAFEALRVARTLDMALAAGAGDELTIRMRRIGPLAARAYAVAGDKVGAELAVHTAAMAGAPR